MEVILHNIATKKLKFLKTHGMSISKSFTFFKYQTSNNYNKNTRTPNKITTVVYIHVQQKLSEHYTQQPIHGQNQMPSKNHQLDLHYQCKRKLVHLFLSKIYL